eukprot:COSAG06_NODE_6412_length_2944_cov_2.957118_3_plen_313_part_00
MVKPAKMPSATCRAVRDATNLLTATPDEAAILIAVALGSAADLLRLAAACRRFALKCIAAPLPLAAASSGDAAAAAAAAAQQLETWSLAEEAARRWLAARTEQERGWVPRRGRESWLRLMWEVEVLCRGAVFGRSHAWIALSEGGALATKSVSTSWYAAASKAVMRAGRHYAQFTVVGGAFVYFGLIRPRWDVEGGQAAQHVDCHCFYDTDSGRRYPGNCDWEGMQQAMKPGDRIGMLLDLDQGSMTVYKNDERLGVMATGLSGEYCWAVSLYGQGNSTRIDVTVAPASPTTEELAQVVAYEAEQAVVADDY